MSPIIKIALVAGLLQQTNFFTVTIDPPVHGKLQVKPPLPADGEYPAGTVVTVTTTLGVG